MGARATTRCGSPNETPLQHLLKQKIPEDAAAQGGGETTEAALNLASSDAWLPSWLLPARLFAQKDPPRSKPLGVLWSSPTGHRAESPQSWQPSSAQPKPLLPHKQPNRKPQALIRAWKGSVKHDPDVEQGLEAHTWSRQGPWRSQFPLHDHSDKNVILKATPTAAAAPGALTLPRV